MSAVWLHVYDVTNSMSPKTNSTIAGINRFFRDGIGIGGIFHGAVQVFEEEWSFGYCENGSGVFGCPPKSNPMYTYRETVYIGNTPFSEEKVNQILLELSKEWPGYSYDLLARNCNHFCDELCVRLSVPKIPAWVNRFANAGDAAVDAVGNTVERIKQAKSDVAAASKIAVRFIF
ncbi:hypothetical protein SELMODRAFT_16111, partial [Selaginella moellendorffii]